MIQNFSDVVQEGLMVTSVGLFVVFSVLILLAVLISCFRFIPEENSLLSEETEPLPLPSVFKSEVKLSPLHQAIVIAAILEDVHVSNSKNLVKINKIKQISENS